MSRPRIATVSATAALAVTAALLAAPAAGAAPTKATAPKPASAKQAAGPSAFTKDGFTTNPSPSVRSKAIADARKALSAHKSSAHVKSGDEFEVDLPALGAPLVNPLLVVPGGLARGDTTVL